MANSVFPLLKPIKDAWLYLTEDQNFKSLTEFKGGVGTQNAWHAKVLRNEVEKQAKQYNALQQRFSEGTSFLDLLQDNLARLTVLSGFERLFTIRQAYSTLKYRFYIPDNASGTLGELFNAGFFTKGYFRGALLNLVQWSGVFYNSLLWGTGANFGTQVLLSSAFETFFYPLDTIKTLLYSDVGGEYKGFMDCLGRTIQENGVSQLFRGVAFKLSYNVFFLWHLQNWYEQNSMMWVSLPAWLASYGLLSIKTRCQVADTPLSMLKLSDLAQMKNQNLFKGIIPFAVINLLATNQIYGFYTAEAQKRVLSELDGSEFQTPVKYKRFEDF